MSYELTIKAQSIRELHKLIKDAASEISETIPVVQEAKPAQTKAPTFPMQPKAEDKSEEVSQPSNFSESDRDSQGLPWDTRIHVDSKTKRTDGTWINRRNLDKGFKAQVESELRRIPASDPIPVSPPTFIEQPSNPQVSPAVQPVVAPVAQPAVEVAPLPTPVAHNSRSHDLVSFKKNLPTLLMDLVTKGEVNADYLKKLSNHFKVDQLIDVVNDETKAQHLFEAFVQFKFIEKR